MKEFKYTINGTQYDVEIVKEEGAEVELTVNGTPFTVEIEKPVEEVPKKITRPAAAPVTATGAPVLGQKKNTSGVGAVKSPLPGVILDITVQVGDVVKVGSKLMLLEAMKMENTIASDLAGTVLEIKVGKGDSVMEGADLVIIG
jgi:glutaconyl-CoA/methylmalonyl-CoA decarboxylase subunit gamma